MVHTNSWLLVAIPFIVLWIFRYVYSVLKYHKARSTHRQALPPTYPGLIPFLGHVILFLWDAPRFLKRATSYAGSLTSTSIHFFPGCNILFFQDPETIQHIWRQSEKLNAVRMRVYAYKYLFGMPKKWASIYEADDSGPFPKPLQGSNIPPEKRIHRFLAEGIEKALIGPGFSPTFSRLRQTYVKQMSNLEIGLEWNEFEDFRRFIHITTGQSTIEAIFGPNLVRLNPAFMEDLFEFDRALPWLSKGIPRFIMPTAYRAREKLHRNFVAWYKSARECFQDHLIYGDGDGDPFWGSNWMRQRQKTLAHIQDDITLASSDLGIAWASTENMVRNTVMAIIHIFQDKSLVKRVRQELHDSFGNSDVEDIDPKHLAANPLLSSIYAETLRLHVKTYTIIYSSHSNVSLGKYVLPRRTVGLVNSHFSHMNPDFWNTYNGLFPLSSFWADRFITDPSDTSSGPVKPERRKTITMASTAKIDSGERRRPHFSTDGLDGSWIPYGGGRLMCPGRFLAKNSIILTLATLVSKYDIEFKLDEIELESKSFGLGTDSPKTPVPFRIRRRRA
ncbi:cytochrome P450 [Xylaria venustula]|nr:cytochrome P450 [Xylaria venustula]